MSAHPQGTPEIRAYAQVECVRTLKRAAAGRQALMDEFAWKALATDMYPAWTHLNRWSMWLLASSVVASIPTGRGRGLPLQSKCDSSHKSNGPLAQFRVSPDFRHTGPLRYAASSPSGVWLPPIYAGDVGSSPSCHLSQIRQHAPAATLIPESSTIAAKPPNRFQTSSLRLPLESQLLDESMKHG